MNTKLALLSTSFRCIYLMVSGTIMLLLLSCNPAAEPEENPIPIEKSPRETYWAALDSNGLSNSKMATIWQLAGAKALEDSILLVAPFQETVYLKAEKPTAFAYRLELKAGELFQFNLQSEPDSILFFTDLFRWEQTDSSSYYRYLGSAENYKGDSLEYEIIKDGIYLLRLQAELLVTGRFTIQLITQPQYSVFPVSGKSNRDIWSFLGAPRDGGRRKHKGVDVFARRGTPVVATTDGTIRRVRDQGLGGKQVWLHDPDRLQSLYYAHLDSQMVAEGQRVFAGDTLGTVGNTGNARSTPPHLHFGIYRRGEGAVDPYPYIAIQKEKAPSINADTSLLGKMVRVRRSNTSLQAAPQPRSKAITKLDRNSAVEIIAASKYWYRVRYADTYSGYLPVASIEGVNQELNKFVVPVKSEILSAPHPKAAPIFIVQDSSQVSLMGSIGNYQLVKDSEGKMGWLALEAQ